MKTYRISELARRSGLSRSTLLYYDRIGLFAPSARSPSPAQYRVYTEWDLQRLERICHYRKTGLSLADIRMILAARGKPRAKVLEERLRATNDQMLSLRNQQRLIAGMLKGVAKGGSPATVDKKMWVEMLRAAGMSQESMERWHVEFERRTPEGHHEFLASLGLDEPDILRIRAWSAKAT